MFVRSILAVAAMAGLAVAQRPVPPMTACPPCPVQSVECHGPGSLMCSLPNNETMVRAEMRIVSIHPEVMKSLELWEDCNHPGQKCFLTGCQVNKVLDTIKADDRCEIMSAPRMIVLDGQSAQVSLMANDTNQFQLNLVPRLSLDHKFIQMAISAEHKAADAPCCSEKCAPCCDDAVKLQRNTIQVHQMQTIVTVPTGKSVMLEVCRPNPTVRCSFGFGGFLNAEVVASKERHMCVIITPCEQEACAQAMPKDCTMPCQVAVAPPMRAMLPPTVVFPNPLPNPPRILGFVSAQEQCEPVPPPPPDSPRLTELMGKYYRACADGDMEKARKLARRCIEIDPTCFMRDR